jgi:hypothetical protein
LFYQYDFSIDAISKTEPSVKLRRLKAWRFSNLMLSTNSAAFQKAGTSYPPLVNEPLGEENSGKN